MRYVISEYAHDACPLLRDFLIYMTTIRGKSPKTAFEYFLDLRLFLRFIKITVPFRIFQNQPWACIT